MKRQELTAQTKYWKERLLSLEASGAPRPHAKSEEGKKLAMFAYPSNDMFDEEFRGKVSRWFTKKKTDKDCFLENPPVFKPHWTTPEGRKFNEWMKDKAFRRRIYDTKPEWFQSVDPKKAILASALAGEDRPRYSSKAWSAIKAYTDPESAEFDENFLVDLVKARPEWILTFKVFVPKTA